VRPPSGYHLAVDEAGERRPPRRAARGWLAFSLGLAAVAAALVLALRAWDRRAFPLTLTAGLLGTSRAVVARELAVAAAAHGLEVRVLEAENTEEEIRQVDAGTIDLALISGAYQTARREHLREVTPLYVEALHLVVKKELAQGIGAGLGGLRGRSVDLGPAGTASAALAQSVMAFASLSAGDGSGGGDFVVHNLELPDLVARTERGEWSGLPDALFGLATVPDEIAVRILRSGEYALVPLPFAEAFRLGWLLADASLLPPTVQIDRNYVVDAVIPAFTYGIDPPAPPEPLHTLGTRLLLVANEAVPSDAVELLLEAIFESRFARGTDPALSRAVLEKPPRLRHHPGTLQYLARHKPFITGEGIDELSNALSIAGALGGSALFFWQWRRQRTRERLDAAVGSYLLRVAALERRIATLELSASLELEPLAALRRELLELKSEALERFAAGELGSYGTITGLLTPINAARDQIAELILHVRENLEQQAEAEGRSAGSLWTEAIDQPEGASEAGERAAPERSRGGAAG
jgi:TRAP-type uncharacterized transport system substrate-binding protein